MAGKADGKRQGKEWWAAVAKGMSVACTPHLSYQVSFMSNPNLALRHLMSVLQ
jgi:hypothetical protein